MPNILAQEFLVPEIIQEHSSPENLSQALINLLEDKDIQEKLLGRFDFIHQELRGAGASGAADAVVSTMNS